MSPSARNDVFLFGNQKRTTVRASQRSAMHRSPTRSTGTACSEFQPKHSDETQPDYYAAKRKNRGRKRRRAHGGSGAKFSECHVLPGIVPGLEDRFRFFFEAMPCVTNT